MSARMGNPAMVVPGAFQALLGLGKVTSKVGLSPVLTELVNLRASQINGCGVCVHGHARDLRKAGESDERIDTVAGWRDTPWFTEAERAALALTEAVTRIADRPDPVSDEVYAEAAKHFNEQELAALLLTIASVNVWNRINIATHQVAGADWS
ncbi:carboxymuconolactone decarboxylase family protein [Embleya sp. NBC_00896]|uniref:carboxymuconolactone decarboxylase family protein n=1 Tax=Embleya sp. NBC_00896 TaxID=2975961 RepID=UPI003869968D|nr:carboxymuconolactone decarboxylase family protein [Embleya sp. NBC_00896]